MQSDSSVLYVPAFVHKYPIYIKMTTQEPLVHIYYLIIYIFVVYLSVIMLPIDFVFTVQCIQITYRVFA